LERALGCQNQDRAAVYTFREQLPKAKHADRRLPTTGGAVQKRL